MAEADRHGALFRCTIVAMTFDVFLSHASIDKDTFVRALANELNEYGLTVWYDEDVLQAGASLRESIDTGLSNSRFCVLIVSKDFLERPWPRWELNGIVQKHLASGRNQIIPVWHEVSAGDVRAKSPSLADIVALRSSDGAKAVAFQIRALVAPPQDDLDNDVLQGSLEALAQLVRRSWRGLRRISVAVPGHNHAIHRAAEVFISAEGQVSDRTTGRSRDDRTTRFTDNSFPTDDDRNFIGVPVYQPGSRKPMGSLSFLSADKRFPKRRIQDAIAMARVLAPIIVKNKKL